MGTDVARRPGNDSPGSARWLHAICVGWLSGLGRTRRQAARHGRSKDPQQRVSRAQSADAWTENQHEQRSPPMRTHASFHAAHCRCASAGRRSRTTARARRRADQGRHPAFAFRHDGDQRDHPERPDADGDQRPERPRRAAGPADPAGGRRSGIELAIVRGEGARIADRGQGRRRVRLLDLGVAQVRAAGIRGIERPAVPIPWNTRAKNNPTMCSMAVRCPTTRRSRR